MYALVLISYVIAGTGTNGNFGVPSPLIIGYFADEKLCQEAIADYDKSKSFRDITNNMSEYKFGLMCIPSGFSKSR